MRRWESLMLSCSWKDVLDRAQIRNFSGVWAAGKPLLILNYHPFSPQWPDNADFIPPTLISIVSEDSTGLCDCKITRSIVRISRGKILVEHYHILDAQQVAYIRHTRSNNTWRTYANITQIHRFETLLDRCRDSLTGFIKLSSSINQYQVTLLTTQVLGWRLQ